MAYITKRGKVWQVRHSRRRKKIVQQPDGSYKVDYVLEQVSKSGFKTKRTAQEYAAQLELESAKGYDIKANPS
ncbi:Arm DNA-binding domain-containing protein, partial [Lactobacillus mulieris]|uniref:Arm DNA-binding domain-containing protein n=2 Tax=Lactobacillaceae TaxID=33958 RepID=UPI0025509712